MWLTMVCYKYYGTCVMATTSASSSCVCTAVLCRSSTVSARSSSTSAAVVASGGAAGGTLGGAGTARPNALNMGPVVAWGGDALLMHASLWRASSPHVDSAVQLEVVPLDAVRKPAQGALLLASDACRRCCGIDDLCGTSGRSSIALRVACQLSHRCLMSTCAQGDADGVLIVGCDDPCGRPYGVIVVLMMLLW